MLIDLIFAEADVEALSGNYVIDLLVVVIVGKLLLLFVLYECLFLQNVEFAASDNCCAINTRRLRDITDTSNHEGRRDVEHEKDEK